MIVEFQPVVLASEFDEGSALLAYRDGKLIAVVSRLGESYDELSGRWCIEACFDGSCPASWQTFDDIGAVEAWIVTAGR
jgi:hypothetical protein